MNTQLAIADEVTGSQRSSMRSALLRYFWFFFVCLLTSVALNYSIVKGLRAIKTSSFGVFNRIVDGKINAAILITGSSRALNNFDPRVIQGHTGQAAYNIGIDGSQTDMQLAVLKTYLRHNSNPSLLIHSLDSFTFVTSRGNGGVEAQGQYLPYLNEDPIYQALSGVDANTWKARYVPLYGYAVDMNYTWLTGLRGLIGWNPREDRYFGFGPRNAHWTGEFDRYRHDRPGGVRFEIEPEGVRVFEELLGLCKERGIPVLLVYSPVYYEMQALEVNRDEIFKHFRQIAEQYDVPLWDYSRSPMSFRTEYFVNSQHLNADGAAVFSADLATTLTRSGLVAAR